MAVDRHSQLSRPPLNGALSGTFGAGATQNPSTLLAKLPTPAKGMDRQARSRVLNALDDALPQLVKEQTGMPAKEAEKFTDVVQLCKTPALQVKLKKHWPQVLAALQHMSKARFNTSLASLLKNPPFPVERHAARALKALQSAPDMPLPGGSLDILRQIVNSATAPRPQVLRPPAKKKTFKLAAPGASVPGGNGQLQKTTQQKPKNVARPPKVCTFAQPVRKGPGIAATQSAQDNTPPKARLTVFQLYEHLNAGMPSFSKNRFDTLAALLAAHFAVRDTVNSSEAIQKKGWEGLIGAQESAISTMDSFMRAQGPVAALEAEINRLRQKGLLEPHPHPLAGLGRTVARTFRQPITKILPSNKDYLWRLYQFSLKQAQAKRKGQVPVLAQQVWRVLLQAKDASGKPAFLAVNLRDPKSNPTGRLFGGQQLDTLQALVDRGALLRAEQLGDRKQWLQKGLRAAGVVVGEDLELRKQGASLEETSGWLLIRNNAPGAEAFYGAVDGFAKPPLHASLEFRKAYSLQEEASRWQNGFLLIHAGLGVLGMSARMPKPANTFKFSRTFKAIPSGLGTPIQERINLEHYDGGATIKIAAKTVIDTPPNLGNTAPGALSTPVTPDLTNLPGRLSLPDPKLPYLLIPVLVSQQQVHQAPILTAGAEELVTDHPKTRKKQIRYRKLEHIGYLAPATREEIAELLKLRNSGSYPDLETAKHKLSEQLQIYVLREGSDQGKVIATLALKPKAKNTWYMGQVAAIEGIGAGSTLAKGVLQDFQGMANHLNQHLTLEAYTLDPTNVYSTSPGKKSFYEKLNADCEDLDPRGPANMEMRSYENRIKLKWIFHPQTQPSNGQ